MSRTFKDSPGRRSPGPRRVVARGIKRRPIDYRKLSRALLDLAQAQAEADAAKQATLTSEASESRDNAPEGAA